MTFTATNPVGYVSKAKGWVGDMAIDDGVVEFPCRGHLKGRHDPQGFVAVPAVFDVDIPDNMTVAILKPAVPQKVRADYVPFKPRY